MKRRRTYSFLPSHKPLLAMREVLKAFEEGPQSTSSVARGFHGSLDRPRLIQRISMAIHRLRYQYGALRACGGKGRRYELTDWGRKYLDFTDAKRTKTKMHARGVPE